MSKDTDAMKEILERQREAFLTAPAPDVAQRREALARLEKVIRKHRDDFCDAISSDFGNRSRHETVAAELFLVLESIRQARSKVRKWTASERRPTSLAFLPGRSMIMYQPLGCVGVISPWNYPVQLALGPMTGALAAGNRIMLKPSELTPLTSELLKQSLGEVFGEEEIAVVTGGPEVGRAFSGLPFDHLLFTGAPSIGSLVMKAASVNLVPVTLELGGKSPAIVAPDYSLGRAANAIAFGKLFNAGQTCIEPDYAFVPAGTRDSFVEHVRRQVAAMYPTLADNPDYTSIISDRHFARITALVEDARSKGARIIELNPASEDLSGTGKMVPLVVLDVTEDMALMQEEIFGPVLPIMEYEREADAIDYVQRHPRPLALYYFSDDRTSVENMLSRTISGGVSVNDTFLHVAQEELPFGGVGTSGMGCYHGEYGFRTFSHRKSVFFQRRPNAIDLVRPPYGGTIDKLMKLLIG
ncbi:MAG: coniferyl aldehyde dehydrogenase [Deltaproteobacteria bacterium]|nr:coniferyl aldehyde dehydrogenase [Deltaproteobacteria bacterium]